MHYHETSTDLIKTIDVSNFYELCEFHCETLILKRECRFSKCAFPNLRLIQVESDEIHVSWTPFDEECEFDQTVNVHLHEGVQMEFPEHMSIGVILLDALSGITQGLTSVCEGGPMFKVITPWNVTIVTTVGDNPWSFIEQYREHFSCHKAVFRNTPPEYLTTSIQLTVICQDQVLGELSLEVTPDSFAEEILASSGNTIVFNGSIPNHWEAGANEIVKDRLQRMKYININGNVGTQALAGLDLSLNLLRVREYLGCLALTNCTGSIGLLHVEELTERALEDCWVKFDCISVDELSPLAHISADTISLANSFDVKGIKSVKTLVIRDKFESPLNLEDLDPTRVDFVMVSTPGPYLILNWSDYDDRRIFDEPSSVVLPTIGSFMVYPWEDVFNRVSAELSRTYLDARRTSELNIRLDENEVFEDDTFNRGGHLTVELGSDLLAEWDVHIDYTPFVAPAFLLLGWFLGSL